jgi:hypothetical protein
VSGPSTSGESSVGETTQPVLDLGTMPDLDGTPVGCQGKIDLLFVISRTGLMAGRQAQLVDAFPKFIETIESKFDDFDYHIMVIDGDDEWGSDNCNNDCPVLDCKIGDKCCGINPEPEKVGKPCCGVEDLPLRVPRRPPRLRDDDRRRHPVPRRGLRVQQAVPDRRRPPLHGQGPDRPADTFACVGEDRGERGGKLGEALTAAMQKNINGPGGCNDGFLRDDALLMVTLHPGQPGRGRRRSGLRRLRGGLGQGRARREARRS